MKRICERGLGRGGKSGEPGGHWNTPHGAEQLFGVGEASALVGSFLPLVIRIVGTISGIEGGDVKCSPAKGKKATRARMEHGGA